MDCKDHIACLVGEDRIVLGGGVVEELEAFLHCLFHWACLFGGKSAEGSEHGAVNCSGQK